MERRQFARIKVDMLLKFRTLEQFENLVDAKANDLSLGGMFVATQNVKPVGTRVKIELPIEDGGSTCVKATVRSIRYINGKKMGMGIEFDELAEPARSLISSLVERQEKKKRAANAR